MIYLESELDPLQQLSLRDFSYSRLDTFKRCNLKYYYNYILKVPQDQHPAATLGNIIHKALEITIEDGQEINLRELLSNYRECIPEFDRERKVSDKLISEGEEMLVHFHNANKGPQRVFKKEMPFSLVIGGGRFNGFIDLVSVSENQVNLVDYKCVTANTTFWRSNGALVRAEELEVGDVIVGYKDGLLHETTVHNIEVNPPEFCYSVKLWSGREVVVNGQHPFLTPTGWKTAKDLMAGDQVLVALGLAEMSQNLDLDAEKELSAPDTKVLSSLMKEGPFPSYLDFRDYLFEAPVSYWSELIRTLFRKKFMINCANSTIASDIQTILSYLGINSKINLLLVKGDWQVSIAPDSKSDFFALYSGKIAGQRECIDKVTSRQLVDRRETYAITVDENHTHVTNGIVTHNSGKIETAAKNIHKDLQLGVYSLAAKKLWPEKQIHAQLYYLRTGRRKSHLFTQEDFDYAQSSLCELVETVLTTRDFKPTTNTRECEWCSYAKDATCPVGFRRLKNKGLIFEDYG